MITIVHIAKPVGGVGVYINLLSRFINNQSFKNIVLCNTNDAIIDLVDKKNNLIEVYHIDIEREINFKNDIRCFKQIVDHLKKINPNIIHCHSAKAGILGRIAGRKLKISTLYTPHAYSYLSADSSRKKWLFKKIEQVFKYFPSKTLACSTSEYNRTIADLKFKKKKVVLWNNSVENNFHLKEYNSILPENYICSIGRPSYQKNTELLIQSINQLKKLIPDIHLVILGAGHYSPELENVRNSIINFKLENNITIINWLERSELLYVLKKSDLYISTSRYEGLPYALIEALALSKACVVTNVDGNKDLVINKNNGFLVNLKPKEISEKIFSILNNEELKKQMEEISLKMFNKNFDIETNILLLEQIYLQSV